jgi:hypothetical protein
MTIIYLATLPFLAWLFAWCVSDLIKSRRILLAALLFSLGAVVFSHTTTIILVRSL